MTENYDVLKTREDVINRICVVLEIERTSEGGYLTREEFVEVLKRVQALTDKE